MTFIFQGDIELSVGFVWCSCAVRLGSRPADLRKIKVVLVGFFYLVFTYILLNVDYFAKFE